MRVRATHAVQRRSKSGSRPYSAWFREHKTQLGPLDRYKYIDDGGIYTGSQSVHNPGKEGYRYDVPHKTTGKPCKQPLMGYRFPPETMQRLLAEDRILFGDDEDKIIELKVYAHEYLEKLASVIDLDGRLGAYDLKALFPEVARVFTNPKPVRFLMELFAFVLKSDDIGIDFFAGSCASAEAAMRLNAKDGGKRRFISVQLPERLTDNESGTHARSLGLETIADLGRERIRRAGKALDAQEGNLAGGADRGFRVLRLDSSNIKSWDGDPAEVDAKLLAAIDNIKPERSDDDLLYELLLKFGLDLAVPIERRMIAGKAVHVIGAGALVVCLADKLSLETVDGIAALKAELRPEVMRVVFRDACFETDVVKTNAVQILRRAGILDIKSL